MAEHRYGHEDTCNSKQGPSGGFSAERYPESRTRKHPAIGQADKGGFHASTAHFADPERTLVKEHRPSRLISDEESTND